MLIFFQSVFRKSHLFFLFIFNFTSTYSQNKNVPTISTLNQRSFLFKLNQRFIFNVASILIYKIFQRCRLTLKQLWSNAEMSAGILVNSRNVSIVKIYTPFSYCTCYIHCISTNFRKLARLNFFSLSLFFLRGVVVVFFFRGATKHSI